MAPEAHLRSARDSRRIGPGRLVTSLALAVAVMVESAHTANAALFLIFDRTSGPPGTVVNVQTGGNGACASCPSRMPLYFVAAAVSDAITAPDDPRLVPLGHLNVEGRGNGTAKLVVPQVPNGRYIVMAYCRPCAPYSAGRAMLPVGPFPTPFRVLGSAANGTSAIWPWIVVGALGALFLATALGWSFRRRRAQPSASR